MPQALLQRKRTVSKTPTTERANPKRLCPESQPQNHRSTEPQSAQPVGMMLAFAHVRNLSTRAIVSLRLCTIIVQARHHHRHALAARRRSVLARPDLSERQLSAFRLLIFRFWCAFWLLYVCMNGVARASYWYMLNILGFGLVCWYVSQPTESEIE